MASPKGLLEKDRARNFIRGAKEDNAKVTYPSGFLIQAGHGPFTMGILAGGTVSIPDFGFQGRLGALREAHLVPIKIGESVVLFRNSSLVRALDYVIDLAHQGVRVDVVFMCMGGVGSNAWRRRVKEAYNLGITMVTAAGNHFGGLTPRRLVAPAKYDEVIASCGVTYDEEPYYRANNLMCLQGNFGPDRLMHTAMTAYTPNITSLVSGCSDRAKTVIWGGGTSSATPQIAAAAAMYCHKYRDTLDNFANPADKTRSVMRALFASAAEGPDPKYVGNGILRAKDALDVPPTEAEPALRRQDDYAQQLLRELTPEAKTRVHPIALRMFETEFEQLVDQDRETAEIAESPAFGDERLPSKVDGLVDHVTARKQA